MILMLIELQCQCGKKVRADADTAGKTIMCMRCNRELTVPLPTRADPHTGGGPRSAAPVARTWRDGLYWVLVVFLVPLAFSLAQPERSLLEDVKHGTPPHLWPKVEELIERGAGLEEILSILPGQRLQGALLGRHSKAQYLFALTAIAVFWCVILAVFPPGVTEPRYLLYVGGATGTLGVALLLMSHVTPLGIFVEVAMFRAEDARSSFFAVLGGFTIGVGLFEELAKLIPLWWYYRRHRDLDWRMACLWGLASGAGFGISEGIMYSERYYNGLLDADMYVVRFASCVALHAIWTASAGISLARNREPFQEFFRLSKTDDMFKGFSGEVLAEKSSDAMLRYTLLFVALLRVVVVVIFLHGLYDAALTRQLNAVALGTAVISFGWLAWQIESCRQEEESPAEETTSLAL